MTSSDNDRAVLDAILDSWDRHNRALLNLIAALPPAALAARALPGSPTVAAMCGHMHHERMISLVENAPEFAGEVPATEWGFEGDALQIGGMFTESATRVRDAVVTRTAEHRLLDKDFLHPVQFVQFLIFHESYHHGQIKLALKASGQSLPDDVIGPLVWDVWRSRGQHTLNADTTS